MAGRCMLKVVKKGRTAFTKLEKNDWLKAANFVETLLPSIIYFPTELLDFPEKIALETTRSDKPEEKIPYKENFYYQVLEDVLKAIDPRLEIETHLLDRAKNSTTGNKQNLEALILRIEAHLDKTVLKEWKSIFKNSSTGKKFRLFLSQDSKRHWQAEIKLADGLGLYSLNERSAGFRWFFAFTMLVRYRTNRNDRILFLFDEPAANLHPRAQMQLLEIFDLLSAKYQFIYTTHSHHLVNPLWLESTYVVKNEAFDDLSEAFDADPAEASISITPYRKFVGSHPEQYFYYKPVLEALEYAPSKLAPTGSCVLIEGKTDFYCFEYFNKIVFDNKYSISLCPGGGSGSLDTLISLLYGWGQNFVILLDSDKSGIAEKERYKEKFELIVKDKILTLSDIIENSENLRIENLFSDVDLEKIRDTYFPSEKKLKKNHLHQAIQEMLASRQKIDFEEKTFDAFHMTLATLEGKLSQMK